MDTYFIAYDVDEVRSDVYYQSKGYDTREEAQARLDTYPELLRGGFAIYHVVIERLDDGRTSTRDGSDTT